MGLQHLFQIVKFLNKAGEYAQLDADKIAEAGDDAVRHVAYHRRIVFVSAILGVIGATLGLIFFYLAISGKFRVQEKAMLMMLMAPLVFGVIGLVYGVSIMGLFAPRGFLSGPLGEKWMEVVGTKSPMFARFLCFLVTLLFTAFLACVCWGAWRDHTKPGAPLF